MIKWKDAKTLGEFVHNERLKQGLSVTQLAKRSGVSATSIRAIEAGKANPRLGTIIAVHRGLGCAKEAFGLDLKPFE